MAWVAGSEPSEHFEIHLVWELFSEVTHPETKPANNICSMRDRSYSDRGPERFGYGGRELTFMILGEAEVERLFRLSAAYQGYLPCIWADTTKEGLDALLAAAGTMVGRPSD
jgi:hypothetical protein